MLMELLNHTITVALVILAVIILRNIFGNHISPAFRYALWLLVVLKLFIPFTFIESGYGLNSLVEKGIAYIQTMSGDERLYLVSDDKNSNEMPVDAVSIIDKDEIDNENISTVGSVMPIDSSTESISINSLNSNDREWERPWDHSEMLTEILVLGIWLAGVSVLTLLMLFCNIHMYLRIKKKRILLDKEDVPIRVYISDCVKVPCLFGFFRPSIYLSEECLADEIMEKQILMHEYVHYKQKDHIWSIIRSICLVLYWYHPLVWVAVRLSGTDSELACDWKTIKILGEENRAVYGKTLIKISYENRERKNTFMCATGITNDTKELKKRLKILVNKTRKSILLAVIALVSSLCLAGFVFGEENLLEVPEYPLSADVLSAALEEVGLNWTISDEQSWMENQRAFTLVNSENSIVASVSAAGDENGRSLMFGFMSKRNELSDKNNIQEPVTDDEFLKVLEMTAVLYGDLESETKIAEDYQKNFEEKSTIKDVAGEMASMESGFTYAKEGKWVSQYGDITFRVNFGYMNGTEEIDYQSIGLYNSGDYILFTDDMEEDEVFEAKPEITINDISEDEFISIYENAYHDEFAGFYYSQKPGIYRFFEVRIKDEEYCPEYPFDIKMYFGVNLSENENNLDRAFVFENEREDYYFLPTAVNYGFSVEPDTFDGGKLLSGKLGINRLVLKDDKGEIVQQKAYNYSTTFEIKVSEEELAKDESVEIMDILDVIYNIPDDTENVAEEYIEEDTAVSTTYETDNASCSFSKDAATGEIVSVTCIQSGMDYESESVLIDEDIISKKFDDALTIYSAMAGTTDRQLVSGAYHYKRNSENVIPHGNVNYIFVMDNGDFIKILYNLKYDIFWNAVKVSNYEVYLNELTNSSVYDKEQGIEREFIERFNYEIEKAELSEEVTVSENSDLHIPTVENVLENGYPVNKNGQTYGPELRSNMDPRVPDLILAKNEDDIIGYVSNREMTGYDTALEEVLENPNPGLDVLPMYLHDGETVIGEFELR